MTRNSLILPTERLQNI